MISASVMKELKILGGVVAGDDLYKTSTINIFAYLRNDVGFPTSLHVIFNGYFCLVASSLLG